KKKKNEWRRRRSDVRSAILWKKHQEEPVAEVTRRHRMAWVAAVGRRDITFDRILPSKRVCSLHFHSV
ncbi:hypothetical protein ILYODFUR_036925, partial [Ilyodon furcidens]